MRRVWGRDESYRWPSAKPIWTLTTVLLAIAAAIGAATYAYDYQWTWFERAYFQTYSQTVWRPWLTTSSYTLVYRIEGKQQRLATEVDFSDPAVVAGKAKLEWRRGTYNQAQLQRWLETAVYGGQSPWAQLWNPMWKVAAIVLVFGLVIAVPRDAERRRVRKYGRRTKGPELVTAAAFNSRQPADGIGFPTTARRTLLDSIAPTDERTVRIPRERESSHVLIMGDTGAGKSSLFRQILLQVQERGETAIVYDPALEYTPQFYDAERGDVILNPVDARMPYWSPCDEVQHEAEAEGLAAALFKDDWRTNPFFVMVPRQIFAHLLIEQPKRTPQELLAILRNEGELAKRLQGTAHAAAIYPDAGPQRGGMIATLNSVSNALALLPRREDVQTTWTAADWAQERRGWLFVTSPPEFRERLRPLISMWLDMLVMRLLNQGQPGARPVWFMLDELHSLHALPQLHTAITESRKARNPVVLGFQGRSQLEELYGHKAEAMFSQPATKIFLRTDEAHSAKWVSETIGDIEIERLRESRAEGHFPSARDSRSHQLERITEPLVMASEIQGLPNLHGYLKSGNLVVRMAFPYVQLPARAPGLVAREGAARRREPDGRTTPPDRPQAPPPLATPPPTVDAASEPYFR